MFDRLLAKDFKKAVKSFATVILTGARQTGKTTLCRELLKSSHQTSFNAQK